MEAPIGSLIRFSDVRKVTGLRPHPLTRRLQRANVDYFIDRYDKRQRCLDAKDLPLLIASEPVRRRGTSRA